MFPTAPQVLSSAGTIVLEPSVPSRRSKEKAGKGGALRTAFWERVVFWVPGARHSLASRLRFLTFVPEPKRSLQFLGEERRLTRKRRAKLP